MVEELDNRIYFGNMPSRGCEELLGIENLSLSVVLITDVFDLNEEIKAHEVEEYNLLDWSV